MFVKYEVKKTIHLLLFLLRSLGGKAGTEKIYALFYLGDLKFLATYGRLTYGNFYLAMRSGPVPYNVLWLLLEMRSHAEDSMADMIKRHVANDDGTLTALVKYDINYLSQEEVNCMFEIIRQYKDVPQEELKEMTRGRSWQQAEERSLISVVRMAEEVNASEQIVMTVLQKYEGDRWPKL